MNADKSLLKRFLANPGTPMDVDSNPLTKALRCRILSADPENGVVHVAFEPGDEFLQGNNVIQGGIVATMLDFAMAFAAMAVLPEGQGGTTTSMTVSYLRPVKPGRLEAVGTLDKKGRSVLFARAELRPEGGGDLLATATSVLSVVS